MLWKIFRVCYAQKMSDLNQQSFPRYRTSHKNSWRTSWKRYPMFVDQPSFGWAPQVVSQISQKMCHSRGQGAIKSFSKVKELLSSPLTMQKLHQYLLALYLNFFTIQSTQIHVVSTCHARINNSMTVTAY